MTKTNRKFKGPERRRSNRIHQQFIAKVQVDAGGEPSPWNIVLARNMGAEGILFNVERPLEATTPLKLVMNFPLTPGPIACEARVVRSAPIEGEEKYETAAVFTRIDEMAREAIRGAADPSFLSP